MVVEAVVEVLVVEAGTARVVDPSGRVVGDESEAPFEQAEAKTATPMHAIVTAAQLGPGLTVDW